MVPPEGESNNNKKAAENLCGFRLRFNSKRLGNVGNGTQMHFQRLSNTPYRATVVGQGVGDELASVQGVEAQADGGQESESQAAEDQGNDAQSNEAQANEEVEVNLSSLLNEWLQQSGSVRFQMLYEKHKGIYATEVEDLVGQFWQGLKGLQCNRMAILLRDVGDAIATNDQPSLSFAAPTMYEGPEKERNAQATTADIMMNKDQVIEGLKGNQDVATGVGDKRKQQGASIEVIGNVSPRSPPLYCDAPRSVTAGIRDDVPSYNLFQKGSEDYEWMHSMNDNANKSSTIKPLYPNVPVFHVSNDESPIHIPAISPPTMLIGTRKLMM